MHFSKSLQVFSLFILAVFFSSAAYSESSVWKVSKNGSHIYLGGTVHLLSEKDHPLPDEYAKAYKASDSLVFETDTNAASSLEFQQKLVKAISYQDGRTLQSTLSKQAYDALVKHLESRGTPVSVFSSFTPAGAALMTAVMEYQRMGLLPQWGVDVSLNRKAESDGKPVGQLESVDDQIAFIANMGKGNESQMMEYTVRDLGELPEYLSNLIKAWREGDLEYMEKITLRDMKKDYPQIYKTIVVDRNNKWVTQIEDMFKTKGVELVLVGVLHLPGKLGLVKQLREKGYVVEKIK